MPPRIPPITGKLRKRMWTDFTAAMGLGLAGGFAYWYGVHLKEVERQETFYLKLERARQQQLQQNA